MALAPDTLEGGQVMVRISEVALTSNSVSYAIGSQAGMMPWLDVFSAPQGLGCIPCWGYGDVNHSKHPDVAEGERHGEARFMQLVQASLIDFMMTAFNWIKMNPAQGLEAVNARVEAMQLGIGRITVQVLQRQTFYLLSPRPESVRFRGSVSNIDNIRHFN